MRLSEELAKETVNNKLTELLETFKTDELNIETVSEEVEAVRTELYDKSKAN